MAIPEKPFGRLRERLHVEPSPMAWHHLSYTVYQHRELWQSEEAAHYAAGYLRRWPDRLLIAPEYWLRRIAREGVSPVLSMAQVLDTRKLLRSEQGDALLAHLAASAFAIETPEVHLWSWPQHPLDAQTPHWSSHVTSLTLDCSSGWRSIATCLDLGIRWTGVRNLHLLGRGVGPIDVDRLAQAFPALEDLTVNVRPDPNVSSSSRGGPDFSASELGLARLPGSELGERLSHLELCGMRIEPGLARRMRTLAEGNVRLA